MGKGRNLSPSAVTGGREHIRDTGEHKTLATLISFVPRALFEEIYRVQRNEIVWF